MACRGRAVAGGVVGLQAAGLSFEGCDVPLRRGKWTSHPPAYLYALATRSKHGVCHVLPAVASVCGVVDVHANGWGAVASGQQHLTLHSGKANHGGWGGAPWPACRSGGTVAGAAHGRPLYCIHSQRRTAQATGSLRFPHLPLWVECQADGVAAGPHGGVLSPPGAARIVRHIQATPCRHSSAEQ